MERVAFFRRLDTRVVLLQGSILFVVLIMASWTFQSQQLTEARRTLDELGSSLVPLMAPPLGAALDLAYDEMSDKVDPAQLQTHIVESLFRVARTNQDLVYVDLLLPQGTSVATYRDPLLSEERLRRTFDALPPARDAGQAIEGLVVRQAELLTPDGKRRLGVLRLAFSLERIEERAGRVARFTYGAGALLFAVVLALLVVMSRRMFARPLDLLVEATGRVAGGQVDSTRLELPEGELAQLGRAFLAMTAALRRLVEGIQRTSSGVTHAIEAIDQRASHTLQGSRRQAASLQEISSAIAALDQSSDTVDRNIVGLTQAARDAASTARNLSQSLSALHPEVQAVDAFVRKTDDAMQSMATSAAAINRRISDMAAAIDRTASTFQRFDQAIRSVSDSVASASQLSDSVIATATEGQTAAAQSASGMQQIAETFSSLETAVQRLDSSVETIAKIVSVIGTVSDQTKLLSLNASILAAQAGEHGKSFAVVADEIKALSERTMGATHDIQSIIATVDGERQRTRDAMELGMKSVQRGSMLSRQAGEAITSILDLTRRSAQRVQGIASTASAQVDGSRAIRQATEGIVTMGKEAIASAEQQTAEANRITSLSGKIVEALGAVRTTLQKQTASGLQVAEEIDHIAHAAEAIARESSAQGESRRSMVGNVEEVGRLGTQVVTEAEQVVEEVATLRARADELGASVAHFRVTTANEGETP